MGGTEMAVRNTMDDIINHCFMQLERLNDEGMDAEQVKVECERAKAVSQVAQTAISGINLVYQAYREKALSGEEPPRVLSAGGDGE
jgi:hypothetical protein